MTQSEDILEDPHLLLRESAWLHRLARSLCSDRDLAADLSQETLLVAWQARRRLHGPLRPWLVGVLRRLAANRRRAQVRRQRRETLAVRSGSAPATDEVLARASLHEAVVRAVMKLEEPYRITILLRYFEDLPPRDVAKQLGVPVETVRTRIKRGIGLLRRQLDREHGSRSAWVGPLSAMAELARSGVGITGAGVGVSTFAMVMLMTMQAKVVLPVLAAACLGAFYFWPEDLSPGDATMPDSVKAGQSDLMVAEQSDLSPSTATESRTRLNVPASKARLVGRLARHEDREPVAAVEVRLMPHDRQSTPGVDGPSNLQERSQQGVRPLARAMTDRTGEFELTVRDAEPEPCEVQVNAEGYMPMISRNCSLATGHTLDLGVCLLHKATTIAGRVRDTDGHPVAGLAVRPDWRDSIQRQKDNQFRLLQGWRKALITDAAGRFRAAVPWPAGTYWITFDDPSVQLAQEARAFRRVEPGTFLDLVVRRSTEQLKGVIVDDAGKPVPGLRVMSRDHVSNADAKADGSFVLRRRIGTGKRFGLVVWRDDFRLLETQEMFTWGQANVRLVVPRGQTLRLQVVQAPDLQPIENFDLTLQRVGDHSVYARAMASGHMVRTRHPGGRVSLERLLPGTYRALVVRPYLSVERRFEFRPGQTEQKLVLPKQTNLDVCLVDERGRPVASSLCELMHRPTAGARMALVPTRIHRQVGGWTDLTWAGGTARIAAEKSNAKGRLKLPIPELDHLVLRIHGENHAPLLYHGDLHPESGQVRIVVPKGARLVGQLAPPALARALKPGLLLRSLDRKGVWFPDSYSFVRAGQTNSSVQLDGGIRLTHIPAGSWEVHLFFIVRGRGGAGVFQRRPLTVVRDLKPGETRELKLDVSHLVPAVVQGHALFRGQPAPFARLNLKGEKVGGVKLWAVFDTDQRGRFEGSLVPGTYRVEAVVRDPKSGENIRCTYAGRLIVSPGAELSPTLDLVAVKPK